MHIHRTSRAIKTQGSSQALPGPQVGATCEALRKLEGGPTEDSSCVYSTDQMGEQESLGIYTTPVTHTHYLTN